jgi:hypothetical protein
MMEEKLYTQADLEELLRDTETKAIDEQQELMACGHAAANLQPSDETAEFCVVCELLREERSAGEIQAAEDIHEAFKHLIHPPLASTQQCWVCEYIDVRKEKARAISGDQK